MGYYNREIEKIATRRWKRDIGSLSDASYNKLVNSGVLNHEKEINGLNTGSRNILKRYNGIFDRDGSLTENNVLKDIGGKDVFLHDRYKLNNGKRGFIMSSNDSGISKAREALLEATRKSAENESKGFGYLSTIPNNPNEKSVVRKGSWTKNISPEREKELINAFNSQDRPYVKQRLETVRQMRKNIDKNATPTEKKYLDALSTRHEVDEIRAKKLARKYNKSEKYFSHLSPEVLFRESVNVASMPPRVRNTIGAMRYSGGEVENMAQNGVKYARKGTLNKSKMRKFINKASKSVLPKKNLNEIAAKFRIE